MALGGLEPQQFKLASGHPSHLRWEEARTAVHVLITASLLVGGGHAQQVGQAGDVHKAAAVIRLPAENQPLHRMHPLAFEAPKPLVISVPVLSAVTARLRSMPPGQPHTLQDPMLLKEDNPCKPL